MIDHNTASLSSANDNTNPLCYAGTGLLELHRLRRQMLAKDKSGYTAEQWHRHHDALKDFDRVIGIYLSYL